MGENTAIEWARHTFNAWVGCTKVSPACDFCYAETWAKRTGHPELWAGERRRTTASYWQQPIKWDRAAAAAGERHSVFCNSLADVFDNQVPTRWRDDLWHRIEQTPNLDWLLLTKRPHNIAKMLPDPRTGTKPWNDGWSTVCLGTTVENQEEAWRRVPVLCTAPGLHFPSVEPMLGPVDISRWLYDCDSTVPGHKIDWVIAGGESGGKARPMHPDWARSLRDQCAAAGVPFLFKQWGEWAPSSEEEWAGDDGSYRHMLISPDGRVGDTVADMLTKPKGTAWTRRVGKKAAGRLLDGIEHNGFPEAR